MPDRASPIHSWFVFRAKSLYPQGFNTPGIVASIWEGNDLAYERYDFPNVVNFFAWYVQDDWKVSRKLTLNLGVRYDVDLGLVGRRRHPGKRPDITRG